MLIALLALITLSLFLLLNEYEDAQGYQDDQHTQEKQGKHLIHTGIEYLVLRASEEVRSAQGVVRILFCRRLLDRGNRVQWVSSHVFKSGL